MEGVEARRGKEVSWGAPRGLRAVQQEGKSNASHLHSRADELRRLASVECSHRERELKRRRVS